MGETDLDDEAERSMTGAQIGGRRDPDVARGGATTYRSDPEHRVRGRDAELTSVSDHLDRLLSGEGVVVVIEGEAGIGKSRFLTEVEAMSRRRSLAVGSGSGDPGDAVVQLAPLLEALLDGASPILHRDDLRDALMSPEQRYWLLEDIAALLEQAALARPIVICLDDLHWADRATVAAIRTLPIRLQFVPVGWFLALRRGPASAEVRAAVDHLGQHGAGRTMLGPLDDAAVAQVAADVLLGEPDLALLDMTEQAGGSPFLLVELLAGLRDENLVRVKGGKAELLEQRVPGRISESMRVRLARGSDVARRLALVAGSLGRRFSLDHVAAMLDSSPSALLEPVEELIQNSVLIDRDASLSFHHDLTREAVRSSVPTAVRRALDRQAAAVLIAGGALPVDVASQLAASAEPGDEFAIATLLKAADALAATDPGAAADLGRCALELAPPKHPLLGPLVAGTAVWLHAAARSEEAKTFADTALRDVLTPVQEAEVRLGIARMFSISPDLRADTCRAALVLPGLPAELRARHLAILFHNLVVAGRIEEARSLQPDVVAAVDTSGDVGARFIRELAEAGLEYQEGNFGFALDVVETAQRTGLATGDETRVDLARLTRCDILTVLDRLDESLQLATDNVMAAQRRRQGWALRNFETSLARLLLQLGRLGDAAAILQERYSADTRNQVVNSIDAAGLGALGRVAIHMGDEGWIRQTAEMARAMVDDSTPAVRHHGAWLLALQALTKDKPALAHEWLCWHGQDERLSIVPVFPMQIGDEARLIRLALGVGDHELAVAACDEAGSRARRNPKSASVVAAAAHSAGVLRRDVDRLSDAVRLFERSGRPLAHAAALEDLGDVTLDQGDTAQAVDAFGRALTLYAATAATWDAARVRSRLRSLGVRRRLVAAPRPQTGWEALTDSELAVARSVARGLTNREVAAHGFVSPHTVSGHLRHVFTKLGISSRVELANLVAQTDGSA